MFKPSIKFLIKLNSFWIVAVASFAMAQADGGGAYVVNVPSASIFAEPSEKAAPAGHVVQGRAIKSNGETQDGFVGLSTKSGRKLWIREADVRPAAGAEDDLEKAPTRPHQMREQAGDQSRDQPRGRGHREPSSARERDWGLHFPPRATFDLGASMGSYSAGANTYNYTELNLGLNLFFADWLAWRNAIWDRIVSGADNVYGLDTSVRGILEVGGGAMALTAFAGPGWRFPSEGDGTPFAEAGAILHFPAFAIGGGVRTFMYSWLRSGAPNENQYFIILSGGGSL